MHDLSLSATPDKKQKRKEKVKNLAIYKIVVHGKDYWRVTTPKTGGGRWKHNFSTYAEAKGTYDRALAQIKESGVRAFEMSEEDRIDARQAYQILADFGEVTLT